MPVATSGQSLLPLGQPSNVTTLCGTAAVSVSLEIMTSTHLLFLGKWWFAGITDWG
jgi:hypothetical protein